VFDAVFNQKRKKIKNALLNKHRLFGIDKEQFRPIVGEVEWGDDRGEHLTPEELAILSNILYNEILTLKEE
jgi:16S rRNA A1518/A1519 N6-dimethyltransferase RsmA/KsgA/DIM1 with predicted DNA glycosylase/AP lyase activity